MNCLNFHKFNGFSISVISIENVCNYKLRQIFVKFTKIANVFMAFKD